MATALLILDMQNYFFGTPEKQAGFPHLVASINELVRAFERTEGARIYNVMSVHKADRSTWSRNMLRRGTGCLLEGTDEARLVAELLVSPGQVTVVKTRHSAFMRTDLEQRLREDGVDRVVISGVYTHGCVALSAIDAWSLDFEVLVAEEAIFSHRTELAEFCVERMRNMFGMEFLTNAELLQGRLA